MAIYEQRSAYENLTRFNFLGSGQYDIPIIEKDDVNPTEFIGFNYAKTHKGNIDVCVHFFLDDYQFQRLWNRPNDYINILRKFDCVMSPDFSLYNDSSLGQQGKIAYTEATERRVQDATIRVSPVSNKSQMINFIKQQINIDISNYVENKAGHPRTYLGIHLEKMPKHEEMRLRNLMQKKGVKIGYNGGLGYTLHYIK